MNVDRARFLLLTTALTAATAVALSASGCTVVSDNTDGGSTPVTPFDAATGTDSSTDAYVAPDGNYADASTCLADDGLAPTCEGNADGTCTAICNGYIPNYNKGVARAIADCLEALPTCTGAETAIANCVQVALAAACADPSAATFCAPLVAQCSADATGSPLNQTECQDLAVGLNSTGRGVFTTCIEGGTAGYCGDNPSACIDQLE